MRVRGCGDSQPAPAMRTTWHAALELVQRRSHIHLLCLFPCNARRSKASFRRSSIPFKESTAPCVPALAGHMTTPGHAPVPTLQITDYLIEGPIPLAELCPLTALRVRGKRGKEGHAAGASGPSGPPGVASARLASALG